jgi:hypothetical protein
MKIKLTESQLNKLLNEEDKKRDPLKMINKVKDDIKAILSYYRKEEENGKVSYYDKESNLKTNLGPMGSHYKDKIESIIFGADQDGYNISPITTIKNEIITDTDSPNYTEFFGEYDSVESPEDLTFDHYTGKSCKKYNRPGCGA